MRSVQGGKRQQGPTPRRQQPPAAPTAAAAAAVQVLAILKLLGSFRRVLYLDIDVHHGDGVEHAFQLTNPVLTVSMHKHVPGFFPGTGAGGVGGAGAGRGFALNLPLADGARDGLFVRAFAELAGGAVDCFDPDCVVLQW